MTILLDSSVLIDALRRRRGRRELLADWARQGHMLSYCAINVTELHAGMREGEEGVTALLFDDLEYLEIAPGAARRAGNSLREWRRKGRTLSLPDAMIGALALESDLVLATDNKKDFPMPELKFMPLPGA